MFVQVISAEVKDRDGVASARQRWETELMPGADGFLGSTGGVTPDGRMILAARFESEEAAVRNSERPEQGEWWSSLETHLKGPATFFESSDVTVSGDGGANDAGFVQIVKGRTNDIEAAKELDRRMEKEFAGQRPDILGSFTAVRPDGEFYAVIYFTSQEAEARQAEKQMAENPSPLAEEWARLMEGEMTFFDLEEPWLVSP
ncbi:MAG: hypothetical protein ACR2L3_03785 [Actinomycetota bacterium]